jgi:drug/metabolite transporter (DMT)-like permease
LAAAVDTTVYLLLLRRIGSEVHPLVSSASVLSGAAVVVVVGGLVTGELHVPASLAAWGWVGLHAALVGTAVCAIVAAVPRVGPTRAAIALTWEPIATALLAALLLAERPTLVQVAGGALVVGAAVLLAMLGPEHGDGENEEEDEGADDAAHAVTVAPSAELPELAETGRE